MRVHHRWIPNSRHLQTGHSHWRLQSQFGHQFCGHPNQRHGVQASLVVLDCNENDVPPPNLLVEPMDCQPEIAQVVAHQQVVVPVLLSDVFCKAQWLVLRGRHPRNVVRRVVQ